MTMRPKRPETRRWLDATLLVDVRVRCLLDCMTLQEKVRQMGMAHFGKGRPVRDAELRKRLRHGIGCVQDFRKEAPSAGAAMANHMQEYLLEKTRLGIPALVIAECLHGHLSPGATVFPQAIGLASAWNPRLLRRVAAAAAREARAVGVHQALSPDLDLARDPRWGRVEETYGEDPYLVGRLGVAYIRGMQGRGPRLGSDNLVCTVKHYAAHGSPEAGVNIAPVSVGPRELYTTFLPPFAEAVTEAGVLSVMPAYSELDGVPASASALLLRRILREEWGFGGYTFSDYGALQMLEGRHHVASSAADAGRQALEAGMDLEAASEYVFGADFLALARTGGIRMELIDEAVSRILRVKFLAGVFDHPYVDPKGVRAVHAPAHRRLALETAREAIVLLKNDGPILPLKKARTIAVIGPNANAVQFGDYTSPLATGITALEGIRAVAPAGTKVLYAEGCGLTSLSRDGFAEAVTAAKSADVAVVVVGETSHSRGGIGWGLQLNEALCGEGFDRTELTPPGVQSDLIRAVHETGTPVVLVLVHGRPFSIVWEAGNIPAILEAWYPGEQGGRALAEILFGRVNPSGRLPITVPRSVGHIPAFYNHKPTARGVYRKPGSPEKPGRDYVFSSPAPLFEFGHGLSYTTFRYANLRVAPRRFGPEDSVRVSVEVRNTGRRAGKEVVQLYLCDLVSSVTTPVRRLCRFEKIALRPGQRRTVAFVLHPRDLQLLDRDMRWTVEPGTFDVCVGGLIASFEVAARDGCGH